MGALEDLDLEEALRIAVESHMSDMQFALPVRVLKDSDGKTVSIRPTIKATQTMPDGTTKLIDYPDLEALVQFSGGGGTTFTHPIKGEDEGIAIFSSRSFANWREAGGTQPQIDGRQNDLSDAMFIPGIRSKPRDLGKINTEAAEMRSDDGAHSMSLHPKNGIAASVDNGKHTFSLSPQGGIAMKTAMKLAIDASKGMDVKGAMSVVGAITSTGGISGKSLSGFFQGMAGGIVGTFLALGTLLLLLAQAGPPEGIQQARYVAAALIGH